MSERGLLLLALFLMPVLQCWLLLWLDSAFRRRPPAPCAPWLDCHGSPLVLCAVLESNLKESREKAAGLRERGQVAQRLAETDSVSDINADVGK